MKLSTSAALVQYLLEAADTQEAGPSRTSDELRLPVTRSHSDTELKGILTNKGKAHMRSDSEDPNNASFTQDYQGSALAGPSRPSSRRSANVSFSVGGGGSMHGDAPPESPSSSRGKSRSSSRVSSKRSSIPLMAIISPRPAPMSGGYQGGYHLREPKRYSTPVQPQSPLPGRSSRTASSALLGSSPATTTRTLPMLESPRWHDALPIQGWAFFAGFIFPLFWWFAALMRIESAVEGVEGGEPSFYTPYRE